MKYTSEVLKIVDSRRRELINTRLKAAKGEVSEMYYEGMRVAYQEIQNVLTGYELIEPDR